MSKVDRAPVVDFDHHSSKFNADPDAAWKELRETCPVAWSNHYGGFWVVSDYESNHEVLKHPEVFTSERWPEDDGYGTSFIPKTTPGEKTLPLEVDPPDHIGVRQLLNPLLSPKATEAMRPRITHWTTHHIDSIIGRGECDLVYDITSPVPAHITLEWLGFPLEHAAETSTAFHDTLGTAPGSDVFNRGMEAVLLTFDLLRRSVVARRAEPREDVITYLIGCEVAGKPMSDDDIVSLCIVLVGGGVDTTTSLTSSALVHLNRDRTLRQRLIDNPELQRPATEEFLRMHPPLATIARTVRQESNLPRLSGPPRRPRPRLSPFGELRRQAVRQPGEVRSRPVPEPPCQLRPRSASVCRFAPRPAHVPRDARTDPPTYARLRDRRDLHRAIPRPRLRTGLGQPPGPIHPGRRMTE